MKESSVLSLRALLKAAQTAWQNFQSRSRDADFVRRHPDEACRVALDLGMDTLTLARLSQIAESPEGLARRLHKMGIDLDNLRECDPALARDLTRCCAFCHSKRLCARDQQLDPQVTVGSGTAPTNQLWRCLPYNGATLLHNQPQARTSPPLAPIDSGLALLAHGEP